MRKAFIMISDTLIAFLIISLSTVVIHQLIISSTSYARSYLQTVASDAAVLIEESELADVKDIVKISPEKICLSANVQSYSGTSLVSEDVKSTPGCPKDITSGVDDIVISRRTFINNYNNLIIVKAWYRVNT